MNFKNIVHELETPSNWQQLQCKKIESYGLPVVIFGTARIAKFVTEQLNSHGVEIFGYAETEDYYKPGKVYLGKPVYNYSDLKSQPNKYVIVTGGG